MLNTIEYDATLPILQSIGDDVLTALTQPADTFAQEGENLYVTSNTDRVKLIAAGLDPDFIDSLPRRTRALRESQSNWFAVRRTQEDVAIAWRRAEQEGYALREELAATYNYIFRKREDLLGRVAEIGEGSGSANLVQDLNNLAVLGRRNADVLSAAGFDLKDLEVVADKSAELARFKALQNEAGKEDPVKRIRDLAFMHLKEAVDEVRACGRFVFRKNPARAARYASAYARRSRVARSNGTIAEPVTGQAHTEGQVSANGPMVEAAAEPANGQARQVTE